MKVLIVGHYEIASNYAIALLVNQLILHSRFDLQVALSGQGDKKLEGDKAKQNEFVALAQYEQKLCDELNKGIDSLQLNVNGYSQISEVLGKPIELLSDPNSKQGINQLKQWSPDLIVSIRYRKIFKEEAIAIPSLGIINLHSGLLPEYRGAMATFWSMLNQEQYFGSTLHYISDRSIDTGAIIQRNSQKLNYQRSYLENVLALYPQGIKLTVDAIIHISLNRRIDVQKPKNKGHYYSFPKITDLEVFKKLSNRLY